MTHDTQIISLDETIAILKVMEKEFYKKIADERKQLAKDARRAMNLQTMDRYRLEYKIKNHKPSKNHNYAKAVTSALVRLQPK